jgi:virulence-associated protein VagC
MAKIDIELARAKLFTHGGSQAVRLPKAFRFEGAEVTVRRDGDAVILEPVSARPDFQRERAIEVCGFFKIADWTIDDAWATARLRATLKVQGRPIGAIDALIAGQALARGWTLVTSNAREFERVEGLSLQDWSQP